MGRRIMASSERIIRYDAGNYELVFVPIGEKVLTDQNGKTTRCIFTMDSAEDFDRAEKILAVMREIHEIGKS